MLWSGVAAAVLLVLAFSPPVGAEEPTADDIVMVEDINPGPSISSPRGFSVFGDRAFFSADNGVHGEELWVTDGTADGTRLWMDINPGPAHGSPGMLAVFGDRALFTANDGVHGEELWVSDGTVDGTRLLKDINPGSSGGIRGGFTEFGDKVLFMASDAVNGGELWITDWTTDGTRLLKDINPGPAWSYSSGYTVLGDRVLFTAFDGVTGTELWTTDGTTAGTVLVKDINPNTILDVPSPRLVLLGDRVLFAADGAAAPGLWATDGTADGTALVKAIRLEPELTLFGDRVLFTAKRDVGSAPGRPRPLGPYGTELWVTDGTTAGTRLLRDIHPGTSRYRVIGGGVVAGDQVLFQANDGVAGMELWVTDGTTAGTRLLRDIHPGPANGVPFGFGVYGNRVLFQANDGVTGFELWVSDGTTAGTRLLNDISPGNSGPTNFTVLGDQTLFQADDGVHGYELWSVAPGSTVRVNDQITRLYQAAFGRTPDPAGFDYWINHYRNGASLTDIARSFAASPEFADLYSTNPTNPQLIDRFFQNILGRTGDTNGRSYFINLLDTGRPRAEILVIFSESLENVDRTNTTPPQLTWARAKIVRLYSAAFGRTPDMAGAAYWTDTHRNGASLTDIAAQFRTSPEFTQRYGPDLTNEAYVQLLYTNVLGRAPDPAGLAFWLAQLDTTFSRDQVLVAFSESPENIERTNTTP